MRMLGLLILVLAHQSCKTPEGQNQLKHSTVENTSDGKHEVIEFEHEGDLEVAKFQFVRVKSGNFIMGSPPSEEGHHDVQEKQRRVSIAEDFLIQKTEVTMGQYKAVMGRYPPKSDNLWGSSAIQKPNMPVIFVSWNDAQRFIQRLNSEVEGEPYRLPTNEEWEYAARCGTSGPYSKKGVKVRKSSLLGARIAWFSANTRSHPKPVGLLEANRCGLHDVHGNVWEWVEDVYKNDLRIIRGGAWNSIAVHCRSAVQAVSQRDLPKEHTGFRLVREI